MVRNLLFLWVPLVLGNFWFLSLVSCLGHLDHLICVVPPVIRYPILVFCGQGNHSDPIILIEGIFVTDDQLNHTSILIVSYLYGHWSVMITTMIFQDIKTDTSTMKLTPPPTHPQSCPNSTLVYPLKPRWICVSWMVPINTNYNLVSHRFIMT